MEAVDPHAYEFEMQPLSTPKQSSREVKRIPVASSNPDDDTTSAFEQSQRGSRGQQESHCPVIVHSYKVGPIPETAIDTQSPLMHQATNTHAWQEPADPESLSQTLLLQRNNAKDSTTSKSSGGILNALKDIKANLLLGMYYTSTDVKRRPRNCLLGGVAVFLVVFFTTIVLAAISKTSYLLLRFAEDSVGEMDSIIYATDGVPVVNFSSISGRFELNASDVVSGSAPRWIARGAMQSWAKMNRATAEATRTGNPINTSDIPSLTMNILIVDAELEPQVGIGRAWPYRRIGYGESQVTGTALEFVGIQPNIGDRGTLVIELQRLLEGQDIGIPSNITLANTTLNLTSAQASAIDSALAALGLNGTTQAGTNFSVPGVTINTTNLLSPMIDLNIADGIEKTYGKYPTALGNVMVLDYHLLLRLVEDQSCANGGSVFTSDGGITSFPPSALSALGFSSDSIDLSDYALLIVAMFHGRFDTYYKTNLNMDKDMIRNSNSMMLALDYRYPGEIVFPIALVMQGFQAFNAILTSMFAAVVIVILVLSAILVYSLLGTNGEERQFELAMIRAQGMTKVQLFYVMAAEVLAFTVPGVAIGVAAAIGINAALERVLSDYTYTPYELFRLPIGSLIFAIVVGFLMPIVSNWTPAVEAMRASLRDALDVNRQKWSETEVSMMKLEDLGLAPWQIFLGLFLVVAGFMVYYLMPMAFLFNNLLMFFIVMNIILLIMLFGLCLMVFSLQGVISNVWLWLVLWGSDKRLESLIRSNMSAHASRNSRAFIMFVVTISCVVFGGIAFSYMADSLVSLLEISSGADLLVTSSDFDHPLNHTAIDAYLQTQVGINVAAWAYVTYPLTSYPQVISSARTMIRNVLDTTRRMPVVGVTEGYLDTVYPKFVDVEQTNNAYPYSTSTTGVKDVVRSLYVYPNTSTEGSAQILYTGYPLNATAPDALEKVKSVLPVLLPSAVTTAIGLDTAGLAGIDFTYRMENGVAQPTEFLVQPRALLNRLSGFPGMSPRTFSVSAGAMIMTTDNFRRLLQANNTDFAGVEPTTPFTRMSADSVSEERFERLLVRVMPGIPDRRRTFFLNSMQAYLDPFFSSATDVRAAVATVRQVGDLMNAFYYASAAICVLLACFMTWLVFVSNVTQNAWSFGVLRSLGFTKGHVLRAVMYEAITLVLASFSLGLPIGMFIGFTLGLQMSTFMNLPYTFSVPYPMLLILLGVSILAATVGSAWPMHRLNKLHIAHVIKKYN